MSYIRGLTLWRPWAWSIVHGSKRIENRPWWTDKVLGAYIAIHAGKTWDYEGASKIAEVHPEMPRTADLHPVGVIGIARVVGCIQGDPEGPEEGIKIIAGIPGVHVDVDGRWFCGPYGWVLDNVRAIDPVSCRGAPGLWPVPDTVLAIVRERWKLARSA